MLTHRSWASTGEPSNERLELLGDSVLALVVTEALMDRHPAAEEGDLAWMRQEVVSRTVCAEVARRCGLPERLRAAAPTDRLDVDVVIGSDRVQAGLAEALLGAAWLELGPDAVRVAVAAAFEREISRTRKGMRDAKTALQELAAKRRQDVRYELSGQHGPPHDRTFETQVLVAGEVTGAGVGSSKRASETAAASDAIERLGGLN